MTDFDAIARDLDQCDLMIAIGNRKSRKLARAHRTQCMAAIKEANRRDGYSGMTDEELLAALGV